MKGLSGGAPLIPTLLHHLPSSPLPSLAPSPLARLLSPTPLYQSSSLSPSNLPPSPPPPLLSTPPHSPFSSFFYPSIAAWLGDTKNTCYCQVSRKEMYFPVSVSLYRSFMKKYSSFKKDPFYSVYPFLSVSIKVYNGQCLILVSRKTLYYPLCASLSSYLKNKSSSRKTLYYPICASLSSYLKD